MKTCNKCGVEKLETEFRKQRNDCRACGLTAARVYRLTNPDKTRAICCRSNAKRRRFITLLKMDRPCYDCGGMFPPEAMDWDHLPGKEKLFNIGAEQSSFSIEEVIDEISKCQLVCANCHRIRTWSRKRKLSQVLGQEEVISES